MSDYDHNMLLIKQSEIDQLRHELEEEKQAYKKWYGVASEGGSPASWETKCAQLSTDSHRWRGEAQKYSTALEICLAAMEGHNGVVLMEEIQEAVQLIRRTLKK